ncbi:hypothetical protein ACFS3C_04925 [Azotobacter vinelandii]
MHRSALLLLLYLLTDIAWASQPASGTFVAGQSCEAYQSFRKKTNPGAVKTEPGREYRIREIDERDYQWLRIEMPGNAEPLRWVPADCGDAGALEPASSARRERPQQSAGVCQTPGLQDSYVLAITWQPGFCEHKLAKKQEQAETRMPGHGKRRTEHRQLHAARTLAEQEGVRQELRQLFQNRYSAQRRNALLHQALDAELLFRKTTSATTNGRNMAPARPTWTTTPISARR